jgi:hypothetical protein
MLVYVGLGSWSCDNALTGAPNNWRLLQKGAQLLHVWIAAISGLMPTMFMTRVKTGLGAMSVRCPDYPRKRPRSGHQGTAQKCH